jgi:hypothetical protein
VIARSALLFLAPLVALPTTHVVHAPFLAPPLKAEWTPTVEEGLALAAKEKRPILLALGAVGEARSEALKKEIYGNRKLAAFFESSVNIAAWAFVEGEARRLPDFGDTTPEDHAANWKVVTERWLSPNGAGVVALPQHLWLSPEGEVLVSCPWEIDAEEFSWCFDEALRRMGKEERPALLKGAHPPRRLLLGEVVQVSDEDSYGRGFKPAELEELLKEKKKRDLRMGDYLDVMGILFTDEEEAVIYMTQQLGLWEFGGPAVSEIIDGSFTLVGLVSPASYLDLLEKFAAHNRASARAAVAAAFEQIGHPSGLTAVKKALKKEKDDEVRAEWVRALGACGRGNKAIAKTLIKLAEKEKHTRVRLNAILALGHVLPEDGAFQFLTEFSRNAEAEERQAAILALALGRATGARGLFTGLQGPTVFGETERVLEISLAVLDGANLYKIESDVSRISGATIPRQRLFFRGKLPTPKEDE